MKSALIHLGKVGTKQAVIDLAVLLRTRLLIQAGSGFGKSWAIRRLCEQAFGKVQIFIIDREGEFASLREKFDFLLVGQGGEVEIDVRSAGLTAQTLHKHRVSTIFDLSGLKPVQRHAWVRAFLEDLLEVPRALWHPVIVVVDEAHTFCPETAKGKSEASEAMISLASDGRKMGLCAVFATQRLSKLRNDAAAELHNQLIGKTTLADDRDRAANEMGVEKKKAPRDEFTSALRNLKRGQFYGTGPAIADDRILIEVGDVQTRHPEVGRYQRPRAAPPPTSKIKALLPKLADLPQAAEEKAKTEAELKNEVRGLKAQLRARPKESVEVKVVDEASIARAVAKRDREWEPKVRALRALLEEAMKLVVKVNAIGFEGTDLKPEQVKEVLDATAKEIGRLARAGLKARQAEFDRLKTEATRLLSKLNRALSKEEVAVQVDVTRNEPVTVAPARPPQPARPTVPVGENGISAPQQRVLDALAEFEAIGRKAVQRTWVAARAGASAKSSAFGNNLGRLRTHGLIDYPGGGQVKLTAEGRTRASDVEAPCTTEEMLASCLGILTGPQGRILRALHEAFPNALTREEVAANAEASASSSAFGNNLGAIRTAGMLVYPERGQVKCADWLFIE